MGNFDLKSFMSTELLKSAKGGNKESIYKNEIFVNVENKSKPEAPEVLYSGTFPVSE